MLSAKLPEHLSMPAGEFSLRTWLADPAGGNLFITWREDIVVQALAPAHPRAAAVLALAAAALGELEKARRVAAAGLAAAPETAVLRQVRERLGW